MKKNNVNVPNRDAKRTTFSCILKKNSHTYSYGLVTPWCVITVFSSSFNPLTQFQLLQIIISSLQHISASSRESIPRPQIRNNTKPYQLLVSSHLIYVQVCRRYFVILIILDLIVFLSQFLFIVFSAQSISRERRGRGPNLSFNNITTEHLSFSTALQLYKFSHIRRSTFVISTTQVFSTIKVRLDRDSDSAFE